MVDSCPYGGIFLFLYMVICPCMPPASHGMYHELICLLKCRMRWNSEAATKGDFVLCHPSLCIRFARVAFWLYLCMSGTNATLFPRPHLDSDWYSLHTEFQWNDKFVNNPKAIARVSCSRGLFPTPKWWWSSRMTWVMGVSCNQLANLLVACNSLRPRFLVLFCPLLCK